MTKTAQEIYDEIVAHIKKQGGPFFIMVLWNNRKH